MPWCFFVKGEIAETTVSTARYFITILVREKKCENAVAVNTVNGSYKGVTSKKNDKCTI